MVVRCMEGSACPSSWKSVALKDLVKITSEFLSFLFELLDFLVVQVFRVEIGAISYRRSNHRSSGRGWVQPLPSGVFSSVAQLSLAA